MDKRVNYLYQGLVDRLASKTLRNPDEFAEAEMLAQLSIVQQLRRLADAQERFARAFEKVNVPKRCHKK